MEAHGVGRRRRAAPQRDAATAWLAEALAGGPCAVRALMDAARAAEVPWWRVRVARGELGVCVEQRARQWWWRLPTSGTGAGTLGAEEARLPQAEPSADLSAYVLALARAILRLAPAELAQALNRSPERLNRSGDCLPERINRSPERLNHSGECLPEVANRSPEESKHSGECLTALPARPPFPPSERPLSPPDPLSPGTSGALNPEVTPDPGKLDIIIPPTPQVALENLAGNKTPLEGGGVRGGGTNRRRSPRTAPPARPAAAPPPDAPAAVTAFDAALRDQPGYHPSPHYYALLAERYATSIDLELEAAKILDWLQDHPKRRCSTRFVLNWLAKAAAAPTIRRGEEEARAPRYLTWDEIYQLPKRYPARFTWRLAQVFDLRRRLYVVPTSPVDVPA